MTYDLKKCKNSSLRNVLCCTITAFLLLSNTFRKYNLTKCTFHKLIIWFLIYNWKTEETLAGAVVTLETERIKGSNPWCLWWWWWFLIFWYMLHLSNPRVHLEEDGCIEHTLLPTRLLKLKDLKCNVPSRYMQPSSWRWNFGFETCRGNQKIKN
jgi:hypothetical protein